ILPSKAGIQTFSTATPISTFTSNRQNPPENQPPQPLPLNNRHRAAIQHFLPFTMKIAFLGAGRMSSAIITGLLSREIFTYDEIGCTSGLDGTAEALAARTGIHATYSLDDLIGDASVVVAAFKPQQLAEVDSRL